MGVTSWAIPVGVLAAIVIVCFVFVWWWFPRAWNKGNRKQDAELHELTTPEREAQRRKNREIIERFTRQNAIERGEVVHEEAEAPPPAYDGVRRDGEVVR